MNRFAELLDRLAYEPAAQRQAAADAPTIFASTPDPERGWALAALTGALSFPHAKAGLIRSLIAEAQPIRCCSSCRMIMSAIFPRPSR